MQVSKIFIINLERDTNRKKNIQKQLDEQDIRNYEFIKAVDGQNGGLDDQTFHVISEWREPFSSKVMTKGEIGCALTHYTIWQRIVKENLDYVLILEDDVILCDKFNNNLKIYENIDTFANAVETLDIDLFYLGRRPINTQNEIKINANIIKVKYSYGCHAYILSCTGAKKLLSYNYINHLFPLDEFIPMLYDADYPHSHMLKYFQNRPKFNVYSTNPLLVDIVFHDQYKSTTYNTDPYINNDRINELSILTVGTEYNDALKRFEKSCTIYGHTYKIIGLNTIWKGGDMEKGPGGGQKINLLKQELLTWTKEELNRCILFTDSYDVIVNASAVEIIEKYNKLTSNTSRIVFAAEMFCWPDKSFIEQYPSTGSKMKYLNSGGFMGNAAEILELLHDEIQDHEDDQYYYTMKYLQSISTDRPILLDSSCEIFQTLNGCIDDIEIQYNRSRAKNKITGTLPCIFHGNGPEKTKLFLHRLGDYLGDGWNSTYKYCVNNEVKHVSKIYICNYGSNEIESMIHYPKNNYIVRNVEYLQVVDDFLKTDAEYFFMIDKKYVITNPNILQELLEMDKSIAGPMLIKDDNHYWSNFWGDLDGNGFYSRSFDYEKIIKYNRKSIWNVPYLTGIYLVKRRVFEEYPKLYHDNENMDIDMRFCKNVRKTNTFLYVTNLNTYGYIESEYVNSQVTIFDIEHPLWEKTYIHPEYKSASVYEPCKDAFVFPIFTKKFCEEIIEKCNALNQWSDGKNDEIDPRLGTYENVPTQDIHLKQFQFEEQWEKIVFSYIAPMASKLYSQYKTKNLNISFVVKYSMEGQRKLVPHHDASAYTINICLNDEFEGGGCRFIRQNVNVNTKNIGYACIHPGRLTHYHEGIPITKGNRYILVSFIN